MLNKLKLSMSLLLLSSTVLAVESTPHPAPSGRDQSLSFELLGRGGIYSINYDHGIGKDFALGAGISYTPIPTVGSALFLPVYCNYYPVQSSGGTSRLLLTAGASYSSVNNTDFDSSLTGINPSFGVGYEYRGLSGFLFRATGYVLRIAGSSSTDLQTGKTQITSYVTSPWAGFGFGYSF